MFTVVEDSENGGSGGENGGISDADDSSDSSEDLYERAKHIVLSERKSSISYLQRRLGVGFNRAALLMEQLEKNGIVSKPDASNRNSREILVTTEDNGSSEDTNGQDF